MLNTDGKLFLGVYVPSGRISDAGDVRFKSAFRELAMEFGLSMRLTPNANVYFYDILPKIKDQVDSILKKYNVGESENFSETVKMSHACVALPTCGLALSEKKM